MGLERYNASSCLCSCFRSASVHLFFNFLSFDTFSIPLLTCVCVLTVYIPFFSIQRTRRALSFGRESRRESFRFGGCENLLKQSVSCEMRNRDVNRGQKSLTYETAKSSVVVVVVFVFFCRCCCGFGSFLLSFFFLLRQLALCSWRLRIRSIFCARISADPTVTFANSPIRDLVRDFANLLRWLQRYGEHSRHTTSLFASSFPPRQRGSYHGNRVSEGFKSETANDFRATSRIDIVLIREQP